MDEHTETRTISRARLLKTGAVAALLAGAGGAGRALAGVNGETGIDAGPGVGKPGGGAAFLRRGTYLPLVGSTFKLRRPEGRSLRVKLIAATELRGVGDAFSLLFRAERHAGVTSGIHRLEHPALGAFELFVSPVGRGVKGQDIEAVINRIAT